MMDLTAEQTAYIRELRTRGYSLEHLASLYSYVKTPDEIRAICEGEPIIHNRVDHGESQQWQEAQAELAALRAENAQQKIWLEMADARTERARHMEDRWRENPLECRTPISCNPVGFCVACKLRAELAAAEQGRNDWCDRWSDTNNELNKIAKERDQALAQVAALTGQLAEARAANCVTIGPAFIPPEHYVELVKERDEAKRLAERFDDERVEAIKTGDEARAALARMRDYIAGALPFLKEAWEACFDGQKEKLLSSEERGMGMLIQQFTAIAAGERVLPPDTITTAECAKQQEQFAAYYHRLLGAPNELPEELREWIGLGQTCADGLRKAMAEIKRLRAALSSPAALPDAATGEGEGQ